MPAGRFQGKVVIITGAALAAGGARPAGNLANNKSPDRHTRAGGNPATQAEAPKRVWIPAFAG
ncbi:MAG: hypothetical protein JWR60_1954 [Polaromonas sp.]|nr:hypothetical protein [Polaromonas sp.]